MTAKQKTELLVSWCKHHAIDDAVEAKWHIRFTKSYSHYMLELSVKHNENGIWISPGICVSASTKHKALDKALANLKMDYYSDVPDTFEEMAIKEAVGI